ncbi:hypothetical protein F-VV10_0350 [Faustovirus]|nr:hypothetical protein F-VV10_0350 [Faustovirus]
MQAMESNNSQFTYGNYTHPTMPTSQPTTDGDAPAVDLTEFAVQVFKTRTCVVAGRVMMLLSGACRWLGYASAMAFACNHYAQCYHHRMTHLQPNFMRYYPDKREYTTSDSLEYYNRHTVDSYIRDIKNNLKTSSIMLASTFALMMASKALKRAAKTLTNDAKW